MKVFAGRRALLLLALLAWRGAVAQQSSEREGARAALKELDPQDLAGWKTIRSAVFTLDGSWIAYQLVPNEGDGEVVARATTSTRELRFPIGEPSASAGGAGPAQSGPVQLSGDGRWLAFTVYPSAAEARRARGQRRQLFNSVALVDLATGEKREFERVSRFMFAGEKPAWLIMQRYADAPSGTQGQQGPQSGDLLLLDLRSGAVTTLGNVSEFALHSEGAWLAWTVQTRDLVGSGVYVRDLRGDAIKVLDSDSQLYRRLAWSDSGLALSVLRGRPDSARSDTVYVILGFRNLSAAGGPVSVRIAANDSLGFPRGMRISPERAPRWAGDESAIFFGVAPVRSELEARGQRPDVRPAAGVPGAMQATGRAAGSEDSLPTLVLWHSKEPRLQSQQQVEEARDRSFTFLVAYRLRERRFVQLATPEVKDVTVVPGDRYAIGFDRRQYELRDNIDGGQRRDVYAIDARTGERRLVVREQRYPPTPSPDGSKFLYYRDGEYWIYDFVTGSARPITRGVPTSFVNTEDDHNVEKPPTPVIGWSADAGSVLLSDNWDIWKVPVVGEGGAVNITGNGRSERLRYRGRVVYDPRERGIDLSKPQYFTVYGERTKKEGIVRLLPGRQAVERLLWDDARYVVRRARDAEVFLYTRETVSEFPDYWVADRSFARPRRLTEANPQQKEYKWSSGARLLDYVSSKGDSLQAALYLPADYQPGRRYPTVVYIYEKLSQNLHAYSVPNETRAFNPSVYTSRGYAVLQPDIVYKVNDPGMSAVWCVVPAVEAAIAAGVADPQRIGLHGHSWGGYQTAFLATQTGKLFRAAVAGAALTDMVSMYSSVYWNTGGANQPIFESSQGRFSGDFLENFDAYIRNSPAFHADKVQIPLLLLHNERDGAVDFNQGITFFNTLRALGKDVVLLQYVGENHGLAQPRNQKDYTARMREFFDHFLKDAPAPEWWTKGVPRLEMESHLRARQKQQEKKVSM
ncbi:MAG TPA: prolyl oligopeptidase family serine peptidase [Gemmatimonadaceae bacterium]|nr:prolyl oligopeptidase family serine peptidase [Gemmatimonadaceae bacterium]